MAAAATTTNTSTAPSAATSKKPPAERTDEYNPHWKGYSFLIVTCLINLSSMSNVSREGNYTGHWGINLSFATSTFAFSMLVLLLDRTQLGVDIFNYNKVWDGKFEGYVLLLLTLWWTVGVAYITQVNGIAYLVLNIYVSAWFSWVAAIYTLNLWSSKRDLLSIQELTGVSVTLKSWYILLLSSLVVAGTSINVYIYDHNLRYKYEGFVDIDHSAAVMGMIFGFSSSIVSITFILLHYRLVECIDRGGWAELVAALGLIVLWICGCAILTQEGAIAATIVGQEGCPMNRWDELEFSGPKEEYSGFVNQYEEIQCQVVVHYERRNANGEFSNVAINTSVPCSDLWGSPPLFPPDRRQREREDDERTPNPGSNLYVSVWACLAASVQIALRWKAQQAVQFAAQAQREKQQQQSSNIDDEDSENFGEDDDLDEFVDAVPK